MNGQNPSEIYQPPKLRPLGSLLGLTQGGPPPGQPPGDWWWRHWHHGSW